MAEKTNTNIKRLVHGDKREWDVFVEHFSPVIYSSVCKTFSLHIKQIDEWDIKEVVQEVFIRLIKKDYNLLRSYKSTKASLVTWLTIVARSTAIDFLRKSKPETVSIEHEVVNSIGYEDSKVPSIDIPYVLLSSRQNLVLHLLFDKGMDTSEISELLGIDAQTVRSTKHKALKKLYKFLKTSG